MVLAARAVLVVLAVCGLGAAVLGCGGSPAKGASAYARTTNDAVVRFEQRFQALQSDFAATSTPAQSRRVLARLRTAVDGVLVALQATKPPRDVQALHVQLVGQVGRYRAVIERARRGLGGDSAAITSERTRFTSDLASTSAAISATISDLNKALG